MLRVQKVGTIVWCASKLMNSQSGSGMFRDKVVAKTITYPSDLFLIFQSTSAASNSGDTDSELGLELSQSCAMAER